MISIFFLKNPETSLCKLPEESTIIETYLDRDRLLLLVLDGDRLLLDFERFLFDGLLERDFFEPFFDLDLFDLERDLDLDLDRVRRRLADFSFEERMPMTGSIAADIIFCASLTMDMASSISL